MPVRLPARIRGFRSGIINEILEYLQALTPINSRTVKHAITVDGTLTATTGMGDLPPGDRDWECLFQGTSVFVHPGTTQIGGVVGEVTDETEIDSLSTDMAYVYLQIPRANKASITVLSSGTRQNSDGTYLRFTVGIGEKVGESYVRIADRSGPIEIDTPTK